MFLIEAIVRNPVKVFVGVLLLALFGAIALFRMPMQLTPEVQRPTLTIETRWPGASPQEVEREIIQEQEEQLKSVEGVVKMTSESTDSSGKITLEFAVGADMEESLLKVNSRLQQVREYPEDADEPVIVTSNSSDRPIAWFILSIRPPSEGDLDAFAKQTRSRWEAEGEVPAEVQKDREAFWESFEVIRGTNNPGLALLRIRQLGERHPEILELINNDLNVATLRRFAEDRIEARFERVPGVSNSNVIGGLEEELQVIVDADQLAARRLTIDDVRRVLRNQNKDTSGGDFWEGKRRYVVRTTSQFDSPEEVENEILTIDEQGRPVFVRDVAEVRLGFKKPDGVVRRFGDYTIAVNCLRDTGANVLDVMDGLRTANRELNDSPDFIEQRLQLTQVYDETEYIDSAVGLVNQNIIIGGALTMMVLLIFLHLQVRTLVMVPLLGGSALAAVLISPWFFALTLLFIVAAGFWYARGALVVGLAIPTSIIGTFLMLHLMNRSLNVISLAGMAFAVGMLVDNAVVVLENIYRRYQMGEPPMVAAMRATQEVWGAVVASTLTTLAVFLPVLFVQEEAGQLFRDIALAISSAVGISLIISVTLIPTTAARILHVNRDRGDADSAGRRTAGALRTVRQIESFGEAFVRGVVGLNAWIQRSNLRRWATVSLAIFLSVGISMLLWPKVEYLPTGNRNLVFGIILPPPGYNLDELMDLGKTVEDTLRPYWDVNWDEVDPARSNEPLIGDFFYVARGRSVFLGVRAADPTKAGRLVSLVQGVRAKLPGTFVVSKQSSLFEQGLTAGRTIDIEITGPELPVLVGLGGQVLGKVSQLMPTAQARPVPSLDLSSPEVHLEPDVVKAASMGVDATTLGYSVDALVDGAYASDYFIGGDKIDLTIKGTDATIQRSQDLEGLYLATPAGRSVPLSALAEVKLSSGPEQVNHRERQRAITIEVSPPPEVALESALQTIQSEVVAPLAASGQLRGSYAINLSGTADKLRDTWLALRWNVVLAILITYLLMAALFESWSYPLVIILSVPLGAVGGIIGLRLLGQYLWLTDQPPQTLDVLTMLGFVILIGTVVNNAILIVHQALNHMREDQAMPPRDAILESVRTRIRPIFMTTATTVLGLSPLVLFPGAGSELYRGLGSVVLGGLLVSTFVTLFFVPTLFSLMMDSRAWLAARIGSETRSPERPATKSSAPRPVGEIVETV